MYKVLYRKWRPQTFTDVVGQTHITETLMNEVRENRLAHAYLFTGTRGTGKTSCAKILSKAINCLHPVNGNPCNECEICKGIDNGSVMDVVEIDAASNRGIEDIRALRDESAFSPAQATYRVYIIDEVHMLTIEAFNALLKTLEEPPEHVKFILATTEVQKLPSTILSRCQRFDFRRIESEDIADRLTYVCAHEDAQLTRDAAMLIARISDGGMRDALSLLDRCLSITRNVDASVVTDAAGIMNKSYLLNMARAFKEHDSSKALSLIDELHKSSCDAERLCSELTNYFRNILIIKTSKKPQNIIIATDEEIAELKDISSEFSPAEIFNILNILNEASSAVKRTQNKRIEAEMAVIKICAPEMNSDSSALISRIETLEKQLAQLKANPVTITSKQQDIRPAVREQAYIKPVSKPDAGAVSKAEPSAETLPLDNTPAETIPLPFDDIKQDGNIPLPFDDIKQDGNIPLPFDNTEQDGNAPLPFDDIPVPEEESLPFDADAPFSDSDIPPADSNSGLPFGSPQTEEKFDLNSLPFDDDSDEYEDETVFSDENDEALPFDSDAPEQAPPPAKPSGDDIKIWTNIIMECERTCKPLIGMLLNTTAVINGNVITIDNYNHLLPSLLTQKVFSDAIEKAAKTVTGIDFNIRLADNK